jgi:hypothetical protein
MPETRTMAKRRPGTASPSSPKRHTRDRRHRAWRWETLKDNLLVSRWRWLVLVPVLGVTLSLAASFARKNSVTVDEFAYLPMGVSVWHDRAFHADSGWTPLPCTLAAAPVVLFASPKVNAASATSTIWTGGYRFAADNVERYHECFVMGRLVTIVVLLATCLMTWGFARSLYGPAGGLLAAMAVGLSPEMLAHGSLVTADAYLAAAILAALWAFDALLRRPGWRTASLLGVAVGAASLCKFTGLLLVLLLPAAALVVGLLKWRKMGEEGETLVVDRASAGWGLIALVVALLTINLGYAFDGSLAALGNLRLNTPAFHWLQTVLPAWLPVPLPAPFVLSLDAQFSMRENLDAYLLGTFNKTGFWSYYLVGLLVKTPEPILLLAVAALLLRRRVMLREVPLLVVAAASFVFFSLAGYKNIGMRYLLFLHPIMAVWIGRLAVAPLWRRPTAARFLAGGIAVAVVWLLAGTLAISPHFLAYFNTTSGGPGHGHEYLLDSNIDWGQDLITLGEYLEREGIDAVDLAYFGRVNPAIYGIQYRPLVKSIGHRYVVISTNLLWGRRYVLGGTDFWPNREYYARFRRLKPKAILGYSLYVFDMDAQSAQGVR